MSELGSFITEYIHCDDCFKAAQTVLLSNSKYLCSILIPIGIKNGKEKKTFPIIAGKIGGLYPADEIYTFDYELIPKLQGVICHPLRIAVLAEAGERIFTVNPR